MIAIVVPVLNQHDVTERLMSSWFELAKGRLHVLFIDNGSEEPLAEQSFIDDWSKHHDIRIVRNEKNTGVYPTFQQGWDYVSLHWSSTEFVFYSHNDVEMIEWGWDDKLANLLRSVENPGVCGMFGAKGIGTPDIYKSSYHFTQMMRWDCVTVDSMASGGTDRALQDHFERVMVLDGFSLILSLSFITEGLRGKFDHERFPVHHMYDQDICVSSHYAGYRNYVLDVDCKHHGGVTSTREDWDKKMETTDLKVHRDAHKVFYEKWRGKLPVSVS